MKINSILALALLIFSFKTTLCFTESDSSTIKPINLKSHEVSFKLGINIPVGGFGRDINVNSNGSIESTLKNNLNGSGGFGAKIGMSYDFSINAYFKKGKQFSKFGIKTSLNYSTNSFDWVSGGSTYIFGESSYEKIKFIALKIGPVIRLPENNSGGIFRFYYQLCPTHSWHGELNYKSSALQRLDVARFLMNKGNGFKNEIGFEYSYKKFTIAANFNFGKLNYKNVNYYRTASVYYPYANVLLINFANVSFESKAVTNTVGLSMGVLF